MPLPPRVRLLDPRPAQEAALNPIADSVNIPLDEMRGRMQELPAKHAPVLVAGPMAEEAVRALELWGREALIAEAWEFGDTGQGRLWEPNAFLMEVAARLIPGHHLDLSCGTGRDAVAMAGAGWEVTAVDHLEDALDRGRGLARRYLDSVDANRITWICADLEAQMRYGIATASLVSMFWYLDRPLIRRVVEELPSGGSVVIETFTTTHRERYGKPRTEAFVLQPGELAELVKPLTIRSYEEAWHGDRHSAQAWATFS